jgi:hypothetical protein
MEDGSAAVTLIMLAYGSYYGQIGDFIESLHIFVLSARGARPTRVHCSVHTRDAASLDGF